MSKRIMAPKRSLRNWKTVTKASICWLLQCALYPHPHSRPIYHCACVFEAQFACKLNGTTIVELSAFNSSVYLFERVAKNNGAKSSNNKNHRKEIKRQTYGATHNTTRSKNIDIHSAWQKWQCFNRF